MAATVEINIQRENKFVAYCQSVKYSLKSHAIGDVVAEEEGSNMNNKEKRIMSDVRHEETGCIYRGKL